MLTLKSLALEDFGPFKGRQQIDFPPDGVTIIYGGNGRGKTNLLNSIRFALFGKVLGRAGSAEDLASFVNREALDEGKDGFTVTLELNSDGVNYRLTRRLTCATGPAATRPEPEITLFRDGIGLGPEAAKVELGRLLPEQIARFFLFDGELLQQYEELIRDGSDIGEKIKESIERILGVPVLQNARVDIQTMLGEANREVGRAAEGDQRTRQIGLSLQQTQDELDNHQRNTSELSGRIAGLEAERDSLDAQLAGTEKTQRLLGERDQLRAERSRLRRSADEANADIGAMAATAWRAVLAPQLREIIGRIDHQIDIGTDSRNQAVVAVELRRRLVAANATGTCPTCGSHIEPDSLDRSAPAEVEDLDSIEEHLGRLRARRDTMRRIVAEDPTETLTGAQERLEDAQVALADVEADLGICEEKLASAGGTEDNLRQLIQRYAGVGEALVTARRTLETEQSEIGRRQDLTERLKAQLRRIGTSGRSASEERAALLTQLEQLFTAGIDKYREQLRDAVEREASKTFIELKQEPDFERLQINDSYGLNIVHKDGKVADRRSAGQEHLVALSLIAGLQRCAPIQGPIIMDSPFGRLDEDHTGNVVRALPSLARQVVLLVYETELDRQKAIVELGGSLRSEKALERVNARHSSIEDRTH